MVLIEANPQYAHVRLNNSRKTTVSGYDLAPHSQLLNSDCSDPTEMSIENTETLECARSDFLPSTSDEPLPSQATNTSPETQLRRSSRLRQSVIRYGL